MKDCDMDDLMRSSLSLNQGLRINYELYKHPIQKDTLTSVIENRRKTRDLIKYQQEQEEKLLTILTEE